MNENITLAWVIYNENVPNYYNMTVKVDNENIKTQKPYALNRYTCGQIAFADFEVNSTDVEVDWAEVHQFALCAELKSGELGTTQTDCTDSTNVTVFNDSLMQGRVFYIDCLCMETSYCMHSFRSITYAADWVYKHFYLTLGLVIGAFIIIIGAAVSIISCTCYLGKKRKCCFKPKGERIHVL